MAIPSPIHRWDGSRNCLPSRVAALEVDTPRVMTTYLSKPRVRAPALAALLCLSIAACSEKPAASAAPPPNPQQSARFNYEMDEKCAADARAWFKAYYSQPFEPVNVKGGGQILTTQSANQNHYSRKLNACFAVLETSTTFPRPAQLITNHAIYNVNENRRVGVLVDKNFEIVTACEVEGTKCGSKAEFEALARDYLVE